MIRYSLKCPAAHEFDSWFRSFDDFADLTKSGRVTCPTCGSTAIDQALMAPAVRPSRKAAAAPDGGPKRTDTVGALSQPASEVEQALAAMRREITENSEYVGMNFAAEARRIHDGDATERAIYGEAKPDDARKLLEDGIPVAPLPFMPTRKTN